MSVTIVVEQAAPPMPVEVEMAEAMDFDRITCRRCGEWFPALEGPAMLYSLKGGCPACGGELELDIGP